MPTNKLIPTTPAAMQGPDSGSGPITEPEESKRAKIADRDWIDDSGNVVDEEKATGVRYKFLGRTKDGVTVPPDSEAYSVKFADLSQAALYMAAGFGLTTLMGNVTNTWLGDKSDEKPATARDAIAARIELLNSGQWIDRAATGVGARIDKALLVEAMVLASVEDGKFPSADSQQAQDWRAKWTQMLEEKPEFVKQANGIPAVKAHYVKLAGKSQKTVADLFGGASA